MDVTQLEIAVVGGGYGGASAAKALQAVGAEHVHVYEQASAIFQVGAGIGLRPPTVDLFRQWGMFDLIAAVSSPSEFLEIYSADGTRLLAHEEWPLMHDYPEPTPTRIIHRGDFIDVLLAVLPPDMVHLGYRLTRIEDRGTHAELAFDNGERARADLVVGADGIRSVVRHQLFSDAPTVFAHEHAYRVVVGSEHAYGLADDPNPRFFMADTGVKAYNLPLPHRRQLSFDVTAPSDDEAWEPQITKDYLLGLLDGFDERVRNVARDLDIDEVTSRSVHDIDLIDNWHSDCVALVGDAAHAMLHHQGQGANSAIQDVGSLATALEKASSVPEALAAYQQDRKPSVDELWTLSRMGWNAAAVESAFPERR